MKRDAYTGNNGVRRSLNEVRQWALETYNVCLVDGYRNALRTPDAAILEEPAQRVATFMEFIPRRAYYLREDSAGSIAWASQPIPADAAADSVVLVFAMAMGMGSALPQPSGFFELEVAGCGSVRFCVSKYARLWQGNGVELYFEPRRLETCPPGSSLRLDDYIREEHAAAFGLGFVRVKLNANMQGKSLTLKVSGSARTATTRFFKLDAAANCIWQVNLYPGLDALMKGRKHPRAGGYNVYFGDIHTHSGQDNIRNNTGCGDGTIRENYEYARDVSGLDIYALTDHDWGIAPSDAWPVQTAMCDEYDAPGRFCTIPAFEWTSPYFGHRNVYYRDTPNTRCVPSTIDGKLNTTPEQLWQILDEQGTDYITVPHHPSSSSHPFDPEHYNPERDRLVEIYSCWGNSEYYGAENPGMGTDRFSTNGVTDMLEMGWRCGIIASSDGHDGHPGNGQSPGHFHPHMYHYLGSGRIAVLCDRLERDCVFDAIKARQCYATTGAPIVLDFRVNGAVMGSDLNVRAGERLSITVEASAPVWIERIEIVSGGQCVFSASGNRRNGGKLTASFEGIRGTGDEYYYAKVYLSDGEMAWSSPIYLLEK